jgi:hypothetical protein
VEEALKSIPRQSKYYQCIADVLRCYRKDPKDWKKAWFEVQKKWSADTGCPDGVFQPYNIDATVNGAYIVIGLLYGRGDYGATIDISTRCGYDSDCNPANAAGILGTMIGYDKIPAYWKQGLDKVEDLNFAHTEMSLNKVYEIGFRHASEMIIRNGGRLTGDIFTINYQQPKPVPLEVGFEGLYPVERRRIGSNLGGKNREISFKINGSAFVLSGRAVKNSDRPDSILEIEVYINGNLHEVAKIPTNNRIRRHDLTWNYDLTEGENNITLKAIKIPEGYRIDATDVIVYSRNRPGKLVYY